MKMVKISSTICKVVESDGFLLWHTFINQLVFEIYYI